MGLPKREVRGNLGSTPNSDIRFFSRRNMSITREQLEELREFFNDYEIDEDWLCRHINIKFDNETKTVEITIDDMNEQEYEWLKEN